MTKTIAFFAALFLSTTSFIVGAVPVSAHADLVTTDPVDGAVLQRAPDSITLTFSSKILDDLAELAVTNSVGELVTGIVTGSAQTTATALWPVDLPGDTYKVAYRIVSEDGHPITGTFSFSYPTSEATSPSNSVAGSTTAEAQGSEAQGSLTQNPSQESASDSGSTLVWVLGFVAVAVVVAGYFIWRKRST